MKYKKCMTLTWSEQRDFFNEGINLYDSCIRLVRAGCSDGEIADQLGYGVSEIQETINMARDLLVSPPKPETLE